MPDVRHHPKLLGRHAECSVLDEFLVAVRGGQGRALLLKGEAGVGKSALLAHLTQKAADCAIVRATGVESEIELPYAGLHQFTAPLLRHVSALPEPQREALSTAFGLTSGTAANEFLVGLSVLSLMSEAANHGPLLCVVDDAQWLDRTSSRLLAFVARRLLAERVGMVFAVREPLAAHDFAGLQQLRVEGLDTVDARALLESAVPGPLDAHVRDRFVAEARGNPLALLELPRGLAVADVAGGFNLAHALPLEDRIEQSYLHRAQRLPFETQRLLLLAAAEPVGDVLLLWRAASLLGIPGSALGPAESEGLLEVGVQVRFCHPLARSAIYQAAGTVERQAIHDALARATDAAEDPDRRAWHLAHASTEPDESTALELETSAARAQSRGGFAAAAAFLRRAAELTPSPGRRAARALAAAQATYEAGAPEAANDLLSSAESGPMDDMQRARLRRLQAQIEFATKRGPQASPLLIEAASRLAPLNASLARETYLEAFAAALFTGRFAGASNLVTVAESVMSLPTGPEAPHPIDLLLAGLAKRVVAGPVAAIPLLRPAIESLEEAARLHDERSIRWLWLAWFAAGDMWDSRWWSEIAAQATTLARRSGALNFLPVCLEGSAAAHLHAGDFAAAASLVEESDSISAATGNAPLRYCSLVLAAWRGELDVASRLIAARTEEARSSGEGRVMGLAGYVTAVLHNGLGRYDEALQAAHAATDHDDLELTGFALVELVEAAVRTDAGELAENALLRLEQRTQPSGTDWARGVEARSRALLSDGTAAEALYRSAIEHLERSGIAIQLARAHLVYGEWLRRENRRQDAREQLREAHDMLAGFGAKAFAERARRELAATGEKVLPRSQPSRDLLTAQELQVARLAAEKLTNSEIGSQLFISPRTVEYHLHKVFGKLEIGSRRELGAALGRAG